MADIGETSGGDGPLFLRAIERYGGREAVGSPLWIEHFEGITFTDEAGASQILTGEDLVEDERREAEHGWPHIYLGRAYKEDVSLVTRESWLRRTILPMLPVRITGDKSQPPLKFDAELKVFTVPKDLTRGAGVVSEVHFRGGDGVLEPAPNQDVSVTASLRFVPQIGRVASFGIYPYSTVEEYCVNAVEADEKVIKMILGHNRYFELYREPQEEPLADLIAPHQF